MNIIRRPLRTGALLSLISRRLRGEYFEYECVSVSVCHQAKQGTGTDCWWITAECVSVWCVLLLVTKYDRHNRAKWDTKTFVHFDKIKSEKIIRNHNFQVPDDTLWSNFSFSSYFLIKALSSVFFAKYLLLGSACPDLVTPAQAAARAQKIG